MSARDSVSNIAFSTLYRVDAIEAWCRKARRKALSSFSTLYRVDAIEAR